MSLAVSWSSLRRYEECHHRHYRTLRGEVGRQPWKRSYLPGSIVDLIEREWLSETDPRPGGMRKLVPDVMDRLTNPDRGDEMFEPFSWKGNPREDRDGVIEFVYACVDALEPVLMRHVIPHDYQPEVRFKTVIGIPYLDDTLVGVILRGGIDIVTRLRYPDFDHQAGDFINYDLKATTNDSYIATTLGQGTFYDISWHAYYGTRPKRFAFIAPALDQQVWWANISNQDRSVMMQRVIAMCHGMWTGRWDPKTDDEGCNYCEARHVCTKFATHLVTDEVGKRRISFDESLRARSQARGRSDERRGDETSTAADEAGAAGAGAGSA